MVIRTSLSISKDNEKIWEAFQKKCSKNARKYTSALFKLVQIEVELDILQNLEKIKKVLGGK